jgi:signal transduction histidine kinase
VVLSDLMMPIMDGIQLCKELKANPQTAGIPIVLLTARSDLEAKLLGLGEGADDFILKPFHLEEVKARLQTQLKLRQLTTRVARDEKLAALGTLVGGVAHEVRNPLNGILNVLRPLKDTVSAEHQPLIELALEAAKRVEDISQQLLLQARAGAGSTDRQRNPRRGSAGQGHGHGEGRQGRGGRRGGGRWTRYRAHHTSPYLRPILYYPGSRERHGLGFGRRS